MKKILFILLPFCLLLSCQHKKSLIVIEGDIAGASNDKITLALITNEGLEPLDSMRMKNGHFRFELKANDKNARERAASPMMYQISLSSFNTLTTMAKGGDHILIHANAENLIENYRVSGGEEAVLMGQLDSALHSFIQPADSLYHLYSNDIYNDSLREAVEQQYLQLVNHHKQYLKQFIRQHPNKMASFVAFFQSYNRRHFFNKQEDKELLRQITHNLKKTYPENPYVQNMQYRLETMDLMEMERNPQNDTD
ncbi:MAG: DUF4369 domain-containing protein [Bacteroidales bacterium]|nr:DUF4369 domain-containing protein [Bacteroidales bacterium]